MEDHNVYVKEGRKYRPIGYWFEGRNDWLTEGVWVVSKHRNSTGITNGEYLKETYGIDKMSDLKKPSFAELGGLNKLTDDVISEIDLDKYKAGTLHEQVAMIMSAINVVSDAITADKLRAEGWEDKSTPTQYEFESGDYTVKHDYKDNWKVSNRWKNDFVSTMKELHDFIDKNR